MRSRRMLYLETDMLCVENDMFSNKYLRLISNLMCFVSRMICFVTNVYKYLCLIFLNDSRHTHACPGSTMPRNKRLYAHEHEPLPMHEHTRLGYVLRPWAHIKSEGAHKKTTKDRQANCYLRCYSLSARAQCFN